MTAAVNNSLAPCCLPIADYPLPNIRQKVRAYSTQRAILEHRHDRNVGASFALFSDHKYECRNDTGMLQTLATIGTVIP